MAHSMVQLVPGKAATETQRKACAKPGEGDQGPRLLYQCTSVCVCGGGFSPFHVSLHIPDSFFLIEKDKAHYPLPRKLSRAVWRAPPQPCGVILRAKQS